MAEKMQEHSSTMPKWRFSLRLKGYLAYGALIIFAILLSAFVFYQKNVLLRQFDDLQQVSEAEIQLHEIKASILTVIENQKLNLVSMDIEQGPQHVRSHLLQFQNIYQKMILRYSKEMPEVRVLGAAIANAIDKPEVESLNLLSGRLDDLKNTIEQELDKSKLYREKMVAAYRQRSNSVAMVSLILGLLSLGMLGAISGVFFNHLTHDLLLLKQRGEEIVRGIRGKALPIRRNDEVGELADSINRMAEDLQEHEKNLEIERQKSFHQEKMAAIGTLTAGIAHEVGNPIAAITAMVKEIIEARLDGHCPHLDSGDVCKMKIVLEQAQRLNMVTREISGLVQPQSGEASLFDLNALIRNTCNLMRYDKRWKKIRLQLDLDKNLPAVNGVSDQITQVIMNLLVNASDAVETLRDREAVVCVRTGVKDKQAYFLVEDNGQGMDEETLKNAKQAFFTTKQAGKGTGLGLSLCNSIIESHGGRLEIESEQNKGTKVYVYLPLQEMFSQEGKTA